MRNPTLRRSIAAGAAATLALGLAACGDDNGSGNGDDDDDTITLYSGRDEELIQPLVDQFEDAHDIDVEVFYYDTAEAASLLLEEGDGTNADLFLAQDAGALGAVSKSGMFAELSDDLVEGVDPRFKAEDDSWVGLSGRSRVLIYNTDEIEGTDIPDSVWDLADPEWSSQVGIAPLNASFQSFVTALRVDDGDEATQEWLNAFDENDAPIRENNGGIVDDVIEGQIPAGLVNHYYIFERVKEAGADLADFEGQMHYFTDGDPGALVNTAGIGVLDHASDNDNVNEFVSYLLSEEAQTYFLEETHEYPVIEGMEGPENQPSMEELDAPEIDLNDLDDLETTVQLIQEAGLA